MKCFNLWKRNAYLTGLATCLLLTNPAYAQIEEDLEDLLALDIETLTNIEVSVASRKSEKIAKAPGIISVVTRSEIEQYGGENLLDILQHIPGVQVTGSSFIPNNAVSMRGQLNQHYANRILFLINGRPFRDDTAGGWNLALYKQFPINDIERLEVIRGPGSVLYGTNAFSGVINIITRNADNAEPAELSVAYGSYHHRKLQGRAAYKGDDWSVTAAINKQETKGDKATFTDEAGTTDAIRFDEKG